MPVDDTPVPFGVFRRRSTDYEGKATYDCLARTNDAPYPGGKAKSVSYVHVGLLDPADGFTADGSARVPVRVSIWMGDRGAVILAVNISDGDDFVGWPVDVGSEVTGRLSVVSEDKKPDGSSILLDPRIEHVVVPI